MNEIIDLMMLCHEQKESNEREWTSELNNFESHYIPRCWTSEGGGLDEKLKSIDVWVWCEWISHEYNEKLTNFEILNVAKLFGIRN